MRILTETAKNFSQCGSCGGDIYVGERKGKVVRNYYTEEKEPYTCLKCARSKCRYMNSPEYLNKLRNKRGRMVA